CLQWVIMPWALPPCENKVNMPIARGPANMKSIGLAARDGAPSGDLGAANNCSKTCQLRSFLLGSFCPHSR
ncbi:hypothetical protein N9L68_00715, partial [bacterium]|nr:hypothetical protein [bacterium]